MPHRADLNVFTNCGKQCVMLNFYQKQYTCEDTIGQDFAC